MDLVTQGKGTLIPHFLMELGSLYTHIHFSTSHFVLVGREEISSYLLRSFYVVFHFSHWSFPWVVRARSFIAGLFIFSVEVWHRTFKLVQYFPLKELYPVQGFWSG